MNFWIEWAAHMTTAVALVVGFLVLVAFLSAVVLIILDRMLRLAGEYKLVTLALHIRLKGRITMERLLWEALEERVQPPHAIVSVWEVIQRLKRCRPDAFDAQGNPIDPWADIRQAEYEA